MIAQTTVKTMQSQSRTQAGKSGNDAEYIRKYAGALNEEGSFSFMVSGSGTRGYVPSQAGLWGLNNNNKTAWQNIYQRFVSETKKKSAGGNKSDRIKALKIAQKIADGKRVPRKDEEFLMEYSPMLWIAAKHLAMMKEKDEKIEKSELDEENTEETKGGQESSQVQAADSV